MCRDRFVSACVPLISWETLRNSALIFNLKPDLPTVSLLEQNVEMGCSHGVPIQVGFISKAWTVTAFHCVHMPAHNSPGFLSSNGTCGAKARFTVLSPMVAWADPSSSRRPRACVVAGPATAREGRGGGAPDPTQGSMWLLFCCILSRSVCIQGRVVLLSAFSRSKAESRSTRVYVITRDGRREPTWDGSLGPQEPCRASPFSAPRLCFCRHQITL